MFSGTSKNLADWKAVITDDNSISKLTAVLSLHCSQWRLPGAAFRFSLRSIQETQFIAPFVGQANWLAMAEVRFSSPRLAGG